MVVTFDKSVGANPAPEQVGGATVTPNQVLTIPAAPQAVAKHDSLLLGDFIPEFKDIILPRLNIVQAIGELKDSFTPGAIVYNQSLTLYTPIEQNAKTNVVEKPASDPVKIVVLGFRPTRFAEKVSGGFGGIIVDTEEQVRSAGGTLDYNEWKAKQAAGMKRFEPLADALVAIARPAIVADDDTAFIYPVNDEKYALALWAMRGGAYTAAAKGVFFTARRFGCLTKGYPSYSFKFSTRLKQYEQGKMAHVPVCIPDSKTTPEFLDFVKGVLNAPAAESAAQ